MADLLVSVGWNLFRLWGEILFMAAHSDSWDWRLLPASFDAMKDMVSCRFIFCSLCPSKSCSISESFSPLKIWSFISESAYDTNWPHYSLVLLTVYSHRSACPSILATKCCTSSSRSWFMLHSVFLETRMLTCCTAKFRMWDSTSCSIFCSRDWPMDRWKLSWSSSSQYASSWQISCLPRSPVICL